MRFLDVLARQASASRFTSTLVLTKQWSPHRPSSPPVGEKVGWTWFPGGERIDARSQNAKRKTGSHWSLGGERISSTDARARAPEQKDLDQIVFVKANNLAALVLDCERANRKNLHRIDPLKANELIGSDALS